MKTAIYIEDGTVQLVITPENAFEKNALTHFNTGQLTAKIFNGSFYDCRGGWVRQTALKDRSFSSYTEPSDSSIILRVQPTESPA